MLLGLPDPDNRGTRLLPKVGKCLSVNRRNIVVRFSLQGDFISLQATSVQARDKVKQSRNRPGVAQRVPGRLGSQIS
jgi:hypothetical protein